MRKYFINLANSFKPVKENEQKGDNGRCVAGIEITYPDCSIVMKGNNSKLPNWIRPHAETETGAVRTYEAKDYNLLDIIKVEGESPIVNGAHSEDFSYSSMERVGRYNGPLEPLVDSVHKNFVFGSAKPCMEDSYFKKFDHSLMFIRPNNVEFYFKTNERDGREVTKLRACFDYGANRYDLPVTDPIFVKKCQGLNDKKCAALNDGREYYFTLSLGMGMPKKENVHYKLVAAVFYKGM